METIEMCSGFTVIIKEYQRSCKIEYHYPNCNKRDLNHEVCLELCRCNKITTTRVVGSFCTPMFCSMINKQ